MGVAAGGAGFTAATAAAPFAESQVVPEPGTQLLLAAGAAGAAGACTTGGLTEASVITGGVGGLNGTLGGITMMLFTKVFTTGAITAAAGTGAATGGTTILKLAGT